MFSLMPSNVLPSLQKNLAVLPVYIPVYLYPWIKPPADFFQSRECATAPATDKKRK